MTREKFKKALEALQDQAARQHLRVYLSVGEVGQLRVNYFVELNNPPPLFSQEYHDAVSHQASMASYEDGSLVGMLHLPLTANGVGLTLYRFSDLPMHTSGGWFGVDGDKKYLAVSRGPAANYFAALTEQEFSACAVSRGVYTCPERTPLLKVRKKVFFSFLSNIFRFSNKI